MSSAEVVFKDLRIRFVYRSIEPEIHSIYPRLRLLLEVIPSATGGQIHEVTIKDLLMKVSIIAKETKPPHNVAYHVGTLIPNVLSFTLLIGNSMVQTFYLDLDYYKLKQIENIRNNGDVVFYLYANLTLEAGQPPERSQQQFYFELPVAKSYWIETILPIMKYKDVTLIEIPKITTEFTHITNHLDSAWKQYSAGDYDKVLTDCRKALEALKKDLLDRGFKGESVDEKGPRIDFEKFFGSKDMGEIIGTIFQKLWAFTISGAHIGKAINKEDADFTLMTSYALINLSIKKIPLNNT